ncbi:hypothetical protein [Lacinutrix sp. Hel_I_90]|uniref:hypothetical protein n=1 Tax=Lacinutrix sp. Hel_I_90 TaxID=1249999 RepID=UPI0005C8B1AB|nr:hypothetical protein [Lacinutrix sp. Hel_I_90]
MKKAEIVFAVFIGIGFLLKLIHWPYASETITFASLFLAILYFWFGFALLNNIRLRAIFKSASYKGMSKLRLFGGIGTGFVFSILVVYCLFKLQFWPFADMGLSQGLILFGIILGIVLIFHFINRKQFLRHNYIRFIIIGSVSLLIFSVSNEQLVNVYYGSDPDYAEEYKAYIKADSTNTKPLSRTFKNE